MAKLAERYQRSAAAPSYFSDHAADEEFPILYGFFLCGPILAMLTTATSSVTMQQQQQQNNNNGSSSAATTTNGHHRHHGSWAGKLISQFDLGERGQDVWNSLAIAITAMYIRATMMKVKDGAKRGVWKFPDDVVFDVDEDL